MHELNLILIDAAYAVVMNLMDYLERTRERVYRAWKRRA